MEQQHHPYVHSSYFHRTPGRLRLATRTEPQMSLARNYTVTDGGDN